MAANPQWPRRADLTTQVTRTVTFDGSASTTDWRLPNRRELQTLADYSQSEPALPLDQPFANVGVGTRAWSSSTYLDAAGALAWRFNTGNAQMEYDDKATAARAFLVRGTSDLVARTGQTHCYDSEGTVPWGTARQPPPVAPLPLARSRTRTILPAPLPRPAPKPAARPASRRSRVPRKLACHSPVRLLPYAARAGRFRDEARRATQGVEYRTHSGGKVMGPPAPQCLRLPADTGEVAGYLIAAGLWVAAVVAVAGILATDAERPALLPYLAYGGAALLCVPALLLVGRTLRFIADGRQVHFDREGVRLKQWMLGRPVCVRYEEVTAIDARESARVLHLRSGDTLRLSVYTAPHHRMMAGLELRVGYAFERHHDWSRALALYESAEHFFYPSLDARKADLYAAAGDLDEALTCHLSGLLEHEAVLGPNSPQVIWLRERLATFQQERPDAVAAGSAAELRRVSAERREAYPRAYPPRMRDDWEPTAG